MAEIIPSIDMAFYDYVQVASGVEDKLLIDINRDALQKMADYSNLQSNVTLTLGIDEDNGLAVSLTPEDAQMPKVHSTVSLEVLKAKEDTEMMLHHMVLKGVYKIAGLNDKQITTDSFVGDRNILKSFSSNMAAYMAGGLPAMLISGEVLDRVASHSPSTLRVLSELAIGCVAGNKSMSMFGRNDDVDRGYTGKYPTFIQFKTTTQ